MAERGGPCECGHHRRKLRHEKMRESASSGTGDTSGGRRFPEDGLIESKTDRRLGRMWRRAQKGSFRLGEVSHILEHWSDADEPVSFLLDLHFCVGLAALCVVMYVS